MRKYRIEYTRSGCTGPGICALMDSTHFRMASDKLADLIGGKLIDEDDEIYVLEVEADEVLLKKMKAASQGCPARVIKIIDLENGEEI